MIDLTDTDVPFCFMSIRNLADSIISFCYFILTCALFIYAHRGYKKLRQHYDQKDISKYVKVIIGMAFLLMLTQLGEFVMGIIYQLIFMNSDDKQPQNLQIFSIINYTNTYTAVFIIQALLFIIPESMMYNIFSFHDRINPSFLVPPNQLKLYYFTKKYFWIRFIRISHMIPILFGLIPGMDLKVFTICRLIGRIFNVIDSIINIIILIVTYKVIILKYVPPTQALNKIKWEFRGLIASAIYICITYTTILIIYEIAKVLDCPNGSYFHTVQYVLLGFMFRYLFPLYIIIKMQICIQSQNATPLLQNQTQI